MPRSAGGSVVASALMTINGAGTDARSYAEYSAQFRTARPSAAVAVVGLLISLFADALAIHAAASTDGGDARNDTIALYAMAGIAAVIGIFARSQQRPLDCFVLGVWLLAVPSLGGQLWGRVQQRGGGISGLQTVTDILGIVTVVLLLAVLGRQSAKGGSRISGALRGWLAASVLLGAACYLGRTIGISADQGPTRGAAGIALVVTVLVLVYALRLPSRILGGAWLLGWIAALLLGNVTGSSYYYWTEPLVALVTNGEPQATYTWAVIFLALGAVLAIAYAVRKDRTSAR
jgi:hypothetical protein